MKRYYTQIIRFSSTSIFILMFGLLSVIGQTPSTFNYQAVLRDAGGNPRSAAPVSIELEVHQGSATGTTVYSEIHNTTTSDFGIVNLEVGSVNLTQFEAIDWSAGPYFVEVIVDGTSMGISELLTVPYALYAVNGVPGPEGPMGPEGPEGPEGPAGTISENSVGSEHVIDNSLTAADLAENSVGSSEIASDAVGSSEIAANAVGSSEIANDAVGSSEIATDAVGSSEIAANAVGSSEIASGAVGSSEVADGSLTSVDLQNEPGVEFASVWGPVIPTTISELLSITVSAPSAGYVIVTVTGWVNWLRNNADYGWIIMGLTTSSATLPTQEALSLTNMETIQGIYYKHPIAVTRVFQVGAGTHTFYLNGYHRDVIGVAHIAADMVGLFVPTRY